MNPSDVIEAGADYIEEHGWLKGALEDESGRVCAAGALRRACSSETVYDKAMFALRDYLEVDGVAAWNDAPRRTQEQVVKELRACAQSLRGEK